jgi:TPR repeat protein
MRFAVLVLASIALSSANSHAEDYETASAACDRLAAHPDEPGYEGKGVAIENIDVVEAKKHCKATMVADKVRGSDIYHLARVLMAEGNKEGADYGLLLAASKDYVFAKYMYAMQLLEKKDYTYGRVWLQDAQSFPAAMAELGYLEWNGLGGPADPLAAIEHSRRAAELGNVIAASNLKTYTEELAKAQEPVDSNGQTYDEALEEVQRQEAEQRQETERQNCQYNRSFGDAVAAWSGC